MEVQSNHLLYCRMDASPFNADLSTANSLFYVFQTALTAVSMGHPGSSLLPQQLAQHFHLNGEWDQTLDLVIYYCSQPEQAPFSVLASRLDSPLSSTTLSFPTMPGELLTQLDKLNLLLANSSFD
ncbi:hypothetical protein T02_3030 [Trichinella nativa]|uniref:Uncharacterized protein n=1 Tax=Trichinella nativa TaxID=6335 RepID=A0A0V1KPQ8_9BILA|nr:hypothetical protein T02_3030 [Trichinella nativa]